MEDAVMDMGGVRSPHADQPPLVENDTALAAYGLAIVGEALPILMDRKQAKQASAFR